jgi:hypothetical protein
VDAQQAGLTSRADPDTPENNARGSQWDGDASTIATATSQYNDTEAGLNPTEDPSPPYASVRAYGVGDNQQGTYSFQREYAYPTISSVAATFASVADYYAHADSLTPNPAHFDEFYFDDNGDDVLEDAWSLFNSSGPAFDNDRIGGILGNASLPIPADPPEWFISDPEFKRTFRGWILVDAVQCILRWNVGGGFTYVE